jgi:hypothetical protein
LSGPGAAGLIPNSRARRNPGPFSFVRPAGRTRSTVNIKVRDVSLSTALQREGLAEGQLRRREALVGRKPMAKRWPDEQQPHTRRTRRVRRRIPLKPKICTEGAYVDAAGISVKAGAQYPGRPEVMPARAMAAGRRLEVTSGVSRGHSSPNDQRAKGRTERGRWKPSP